jgi:hypothetical protein
MKFMPYFLCPPFTNSQLNCSQNFLALAQSIFALDGLKNSHQFLYCLLYTNVYRGKKSVGNIEGSRSAPSVLPKRKVMKCRDFLYCTDWIGTRHTLAWLYVSQSSQCSTQRCKVSAQRAECIRIYRNRNGNRIIGRISTSYTWRLQIHFQFILSNFTKGKSE